ncbi:o-succinylbenzoate--CoA ligase [Metabacillus sp. GX 13764]|uniref:o-succinylbenzoate--CoA ligase n=1 Tax=Metabacillus kandeliae TaxID=2900151 RepID=UPI001E5B13BB|nr:o-succinylbenzoate--CoA ligase [Metabacillus kandeliae]MCD7032613.1 o-succinylbenzoate--CoA ligase [Metabacillus kandeliae]
MNTVMPNWLAQRAHLTPDRPGLIFHDKEISFLELHEMARKKCFHLQKLGVKKGDHVAILMKNSLDMAVTVHAVFYAGAKAVMLNIRLAEEELAWQQKDSEAVLLIADDELMPQSEAGIRAVPASGLLCKEEDTSADQYIKEFELSETATIMYTSGTTGRPKGVQQTYGNHWWSAAGSVLNLGLSSEDKWVCAVPLFHISGLSILFRSVLYGIPAMLFERFKPEAVNKAIIEKGATVISVVSAMLRELLEELGTKPYPAAFRCMLLGGGPAPEKLLLECKEKEIPVFQTFGMTETSSQFTTLSPEYSISKLGSAGKPLMPNQMKIIDRDGREALPHAPGEILVKGPNVTPGYWKREDASAENLKEGWFYTGDIGFLDTEGFLYVLDRRSDLIISGGENVYPAEIESVLTSHHSVKEAGVTGVPHEKWGEVPHAFIVLRDSADKEELLRYCKKHLASYKVPAFITFAEALPRNASSKLLRRTLKEWARREAEHEN